MAWLNPDTPNLADFTTYCQGQGVVASYTATDSEYFQWAFDWAKYQAMQCPQMPATLYVHAVYDLGVNHFIAIAQDDGQGTFYQSQRQTFQVLEFKPGVVMASGDESTSNTLIVPEWYKTIPLAAQQQLRTPWGRNYVAYAQMYGPYVVGVS